MRIETSQFEVETLKPGARFANETFSGDPVRSFSAVLEGVRGSQAEPTPTRSALEGFLENWNATEKKSLEQLNLLPGGYRSFVELQLGVNQLQLQSELLTKGAEAISSTVKRLQTLGG